ncbi:hypothetical protein BGX28_001006 [Mortierella sp. GBA30]|nr:hypothetical protein BGX28_001006 [Mortierella sp. GBA30]
MTGVCASTPTAVQSKKIDLALRADGKRRKAEVKLLLLAEREAFRGYVFANIVGAMQSMLLAMDEHRITFTDCSNERYLPIFQETPRITRGTPFPPQYQEAIKALWQDPSVQQIYHMGHTYALADNVQYFFNSLDRLFRRDYVPDDQDILRCRAKSTGIMETTMFDVGGQRSERKKWIHCFEGVTAVLFLVAISGYDQCLVEDKDSNQMEDAMMLFDQICNSQWFIDTAMIMFMNKTDIFREKIKHSSIQTYFPDYTGPEGHYDEAKEFFRAKFMRLNRSENKEVYVHYTDATDTNMLRNIMGSVNDIILDRNVNVLAL